MKSLASFGVTAAIAMATPTFAQDRLPDGALREAIGDASYGYADVTFSF